MVSQSPDMKTGPEGPVRAPSADPIDDAVLPYEVDALDVRGRLVRLGPALDDILTKHDFPTPENKQQNKTNKQTKRNKNKTTNSQTKKAVGQERVFRSNFGRP